MENLHTQAKENFGFLALARFSLEVICFILACATVGANVWLVDSRGAYSLFDDQLSEGNVLLKHVPILLALTITFDILAYILELVNLCYKEKEKTSKKFKYIIIVLLIIAFFFSLGATFLFQTNAKSVFQVQATNPMFGHGLTLAHATTWFHLAVIIILLFLKLLDDDKNEIGVVEEAANSQPQ